MFFMLLYVLKFDDPLLVFIIQKYSTKHYLAWGAERNVVPFLVPVITAPPPSWNCSQKVKVNHQSPAPFGASLQTLPPKK